ncbi:hypothetical protein JGC31_01235 [Zhouia sp. CL16]|nr:hypothetical protein [Zhouia amylolytica]
MCKVIKYNPIKDYGGYGWRIGFRGKGKALNIRGNKGIQIIYKNNKKLLIGTQKPELADKTITTYFNPITTT